MGRKFVSLVGCAALVAGLVSGCGSSGPQVGSVSSSAESEWPVPVFQWDGSGSAVDLSSSEGSIVRAAVESYFLMASAADKPSIGQAVYPGFEGALEFLIEDRWSIAGAADEYDGTIVSKIVRRSDRGVNGAEYHVCADFSDVSFKDAPPVPWMTGMVVVLSNMDKTPPPSELVGSASRPSVNAFGDWTIPKVRTELAVPECGGWTPPRATSAAGKSLPGWPEPGV